MAVAAACQKMSDGKLEALRKMSEAFHEAMRNGNVQQALHANRIFRFTLYQYAEMPTRNALIEQLWVRIRPCMNYLHHELNDIKTATYHYDELLSALERRDVDASQKAIDKLIDEADSLLQRQYFN